jgi:hypothetical protein
MAVVRAGLRFMPQELLNASSAREPRNLWGTARAQPPKYVKHHFPVVKSREKLRDSVFLAQG